MTLKTSNKKQTTDTEYFAKKTYKEVKLWDWLARILPLSVLAVVSVLYFFKWHDAVGLILEVSAIAFLIVCFVWWYWAIYKIATAVKHIHQSQERFKQMKSEFAKFKKELLNFGSHNVDKDN